MAAAQARSYHPAVALGGGGRTVQVRSKPTVLHGKFSAYLGWSQPFLHDLLVGLDAHTRNVVLCNRRENSERFPREEAVCAPTHVLASPPLALLLATQLQERFRPDLLHAHFGWSGLRMLWLRQILGIPLVTTFGGRDAHVQLRDPELEPLYRTLLSASSRILCVSESLVELLAREGVPPERLELVRRGVDVERFAFVDRSQRQAQTMQVLMVGRLVEKKAHRDALVALRQAVDAGADVALTIVGEGELQGDLEKQARWLRVSDRVRIRPPTPQAGVIRHLAQADLLLHCSASAGDGDAEGIPNSVVEAAATGLPTIGTWHGGIAEVVQDGSSGLLVAERSPGELATALVRLANQREERLGMGKAAAELARERFAGERQVERHAEIYERARSEGPIPLAQLPPRAAARLGVGPDRVELAALHLVAHLLEDPDLAHWAELAQRERGLLQRTFEALRRLEPLREKLPASLKKRARSYLASRSWLTRRGSQRRLERLDARILALERLPEAGPESAAVERLLLRLGVTFTPRRD